MVIDWSLIIAIVLVGIVVGLIAGGIFFLVRILWNEYKSKKQWEKGQGVMNLKNSKQESIKEEIEVPSPIELPQILKQTNYKEDFKRFQEANKELENAKKVYEKGGMTYQELKDLFETTQNQDYYLRVLKGRQYGKKE